MNYTQAIDQVRDVVVKMRYLESIDNIIYCDKWHVCPKDGFSYEADVNAYLAEIRHDQLVNDHVAQLVAYFETVDDSQYQNDIERGMVNYLTAKYKEAVQIPAQLQARLNKACSEGQLEWERCVHANDYESFKPVLKEAFDVQREIAQAIDPTKPVYQVLVNRFDKDFTLEEIDAIFEKLKEAIRDILALVNLIPRFYDVSGGQVLVDGIDVREYRKDALRSKIGYVSQKSILFSGTVADNVRFGRSSESKSDDDVRKALDVAQATEFVSRMEGGIEAHIAQGGTNISGGQKQRLSIARAVCMDPEIYIFDDSFSALDYKTDRTLRRALRDVSGDATVFIVAQRIGTIRDADTIIVLDDGRIAGMGTHEELISSCDTYREIARSQLSEEELQ